MLQGLHVIDADKIAHEILSNSISFINESFGSEYISNAKVDRKKLGILIFSNKQSKLILENYMHPKIQEKILNLCDIQESYNRPYIVDIPLFFERKSYPFATSIVVYAPQSTQLQRVIKRDNISEKDALNRLNSQIDIEDKKLLATYIIDNSSNLKNLQNECERVFNKIDY